MNFVNISFWTNRLHLLELDCVRRVSSQGRKLGWLFEFVDCDPWWILETTSLYTRFLWKFNSISYLWLLKLCFVVFGFLILISGFVMVFIYFSAFLFGLNGFSMCGPFLYLVSILNSYRLSFISSMYSINIVYIVVVLVVIELLQYYIHKTYDII